MKITVGRALLEQALEALKYHTAQTRPIGNTVAAIAALRSALEQPVQEPVAWMCADDDLVHRGYNRFSRNCEGAWSIPVYAAPVSEVLK